MADQLPVPVSDSESDSEDDGVEMESDSDGDGDVTTRFPFWKLPVLVRSLVTILMKPANVIQLSMHSRPFKKLLKAYKILRVVFKFEICYRGKNYDKVPFGGGNIGLLLRFHDEKITIHFNCPFKTDSAMKSMCVNNEPMLIRQVSSWYFLFGNHMGYQEKLRDLEQLTRHFMEIFHMEKAILKCEHLPNNHIFDCLVWKMVEKFDKIEINEGLNRDDYETEESEEATEEEKQEDEELYLRNRIPPELTHDQLKFLLNTVNTDQLCITIDAIDSFEFTGFQLKHRKMDLQSCSWLTIDDVINAECEDLSASDITRIEPGKVRDLVAKWQSGKILGNIKKLFCDSRTDKTEVARSLDNMSGVKRLSKQERERLEEESVSVNETSWKVQRTTDGKTAVIVIYGRFIDFKFRFNVLQSS